MVHTALPLGAALDCFVQSVLNVYVINCNLHIYVKVQSHISHQRSRHPVALAYTSDNVSI